MTRREPALHIVTGELGIVRVEPQRSVARRAFSQRVTPWKYGARRALRTPAELAAFCTALDAWLEQAERLPGVLAAQV